MENKAQKLLESLTPGGSEFVGDPEYCAEFLKGFMEDQKSIAIRKIKENHKLIEQKNELLEALIEIDIELAGRFHRDYEKSFDLMSNDLKVVVKKIREAIQKATEC